MINNDKYITTVGKNADPNDNSGLPTWAVERVRQCYEVCSEKNVIPPVVANLDNLPATIEQIRPMATGIQTPYEIDANGKLDWAETWSIAPAKDIGDLVCNGLFGNASTSATTYPNTKTRELDLSSLEQVTGYNACYRMCWNCTALEHARLTNVVSITGSYAFKEAFKDCVNLEETGLDNLEFVSNNGLDAAYEGCTKLTSTGLHKLRRVESAGMRGVFTDCTALTDICCENLEYVSGNGVWFIGCTALRVARFPKLKTIGSNGFTSMFIDSGIKEIYFDKLTETVVNSFGSSNTNYMLRGCTDVTVHFLASMESVIGGYTSVVNGFGGTNTTILYDLGIETTVTAPVGTAVWIDGNVVSLDETGTATVVLADGEHGVVAIGSDNTVLVADFTISEENPSIDIDFDNYEYGMIQPYTNVAEGVDVSYRAILSSGGIEIQMFSGSDYYKVSVGARVYLYASADGYEQFGTVMVFPVQSGLQQVEIVLRPIVFDETYDVSNFEEFMTLDGYWAIDGDYLTIHPTISTMYNDSKGIDIYLPENLVRVRVIVTGYTSSESGYDYGFVSFGTQQVYPTAANIKAGVIANGEYVFRGSGTGTERTASVTLSDSELVSEGNKVITIGWGQDNSTSTGSNTFYVKSIQVQGY